MIKKTVFLIFLTIVFIGCEQTKQPENVLFVCTHGAARSPIAAAYFNKIAAEHGINYRAIYRGTEPDMALTAETIEGLKNDGFEINGWKPQSVSENDIEIASKIVTFDLDLPSKKEVEKFRWDGTPSISKDYGAARDAIKSKVEAMVTILEEEK